MLFRQAAIDAATQPLGEILLTRPIRASVLVGGLAAVVVMLFLFIIYFEYAKTSEARGVLVPIGGLVKLVAPMQGTVDQIVAQEGSAVTVGSTLVVIRSHRATLDNADIDGHVAGLLQRRRENHVNERKWAVDLAQENIASVRRKVDGLEEAILHSDRQILLQQSRVDLAKKTVTRFEELERKKFIADAQLIQHKADLLDQQLRLEDLVRVKLDFQREQEVAQAAQRELTIRLQSSKVSDALSIAEIDQELTELRARSEGSVRSSRPGKIAAIVVTPGQAVNAGQTILSLLPSGAVLEAELYATSRAIGFVTEGMRVQLRYQAFPYQRFGFASGTVREIARTAVRIDETSAPSLGALGLQSSEPVYRIKVALDSQTVRAGDAEFSLRPGSLVDASIQLEKRRVIEWMIEPLLTLRGGK